MQRPIDYPSRFHDLNRGRESLDQPRRTSQTFFVVRRVSATPMRLDNLHTSSCLHECNGNGCGRCGRVARKAGMRMDRNRQHRHVGNTYENPQTDTAAQSHQRELSTYSLSSYTVYIERAVQTVTRNGHALNPKLPGGAVFEGHFLQMLADDTVQLWWQRAFATNPY
jgi:hypothetical protein